MPLRVLTFNLHQGYSMFHRRPVSRQQWEAMGAQGSDLVFLQEAPDAAARSTRTVPAEASAHWQRIADDVWGHRTWAGNAVVNGVAHGNGLLSRFPIIRWTNHVIRVPGDEPRGLLHCVVQRPGSEQPLHAVCVHLGLRESHRCRQLARLRDVIESDVPALAPLVVAGDFNDWRARADLALRETGLVDVFRQSHGRHARSFPAWLPALRLDRIYVRRVASARPVRLPRRPWSGLSDHMPLAAEIDC